MNKFVYFFMCFIGTLIFITGAGCDTNHDVISTSPDTTALTVSSMVPASGATNVAINSAMTATFSEAMKSLTITTATFTVAGSSSVTGTVTYTGVTATFTPNADLEANTLHTATITTGVKDLAGNTLALNKVWTFTTGAVPDTLAPTVSSTVPVNNATNVAVNSAMTATFSEA
ncbi:MAG: Ig-like domain-containing protein, partial [Planctomycetes bacterium]|nr:Ig-like domain-containing protein [Planctomycetota bacterium]